MKKIISIFLSLLILSSIFCVSTTSASAETVKEAVNGQWVDCIYTENEDHFFTLTLKEDSIITFNYTFPVSESGNIGSAELELYYNDGVHKGIRADFKFLSSDEPETPVVYFLKKGSYKFNFEVATFIKYDGHYKKAKYMVSYKPMSTYIMETPALNYLSRSGSFKFAWETNPEYSGIEFWTKTNGGKWVVEKHSNSSYYSEYGNTDYCSSGEVKYYKIRYYKECVGFNLYSNFSNTVSMNRILKPEVKISSKKKKTATVLVSSVPSGGATGYEIYRSTKKNKGFKKVKTVNTKIFKWTNKKLKSKKTYYYKVRTFKKFGNEKYYSTFSKVKKVKIK